ncbi:hypothetical protein HELRODRAFT_180881 [Helobdella robusta]|uniref:Uncharacterized protein n=1 Tax=Helobdella robusta TaxID=6412 RepID=T1FGD0_HELRO|nr:hypothetical protein HELRODRAFT_180881 [Helobdella robusta]ESN93562.1 hypothetical protein HELRODRAFT_180881 [Helobdella robusta]
MHYVQCKKHVDVTRPQMERKQSSIMNISRHPLTEDQINLLNKGLGFVCTPRSIRKSEVTEGIDRIIKNIQLKDYFKNNMDTTRMGNPYLTDYKRYFKSARTTGDISSVKRTKDYVLVKPYCPSLGSIYHMILLAMIKNNIISNEEEAVVAYKVQKNLRRSLFGRI